MEELKIRREVFNSDLEYVGPYISPFVQAHVYDFLKSIIKVNSNWRNHAFLVLREEGIGINFRWHRE